MEPKEAPGAPTVYVVDDDPSIRELVSWLMKRDGVAVQAFANARAFLEAYVPGAPGCLVLDLYLPGMSGLDLQSYLVDHGIGMPVIFLSGRADVPQAVKAVKGGAIDFIEKPFDYKRMVALVRQGLARDAQARERSALARKAAARLAALSQREREVLERVVAGKPNRVIAEELAISAKTVEAHRAHIMEKVGVDSLAELVQATLAARDP
jgi:two-component system response regulator TtrR